MNRSQIICAPVGIKPDYPTNCFLCVNSRENRLFIVDPGFHPDVIARRIEKTGAVPSAILLTHGHYDHMMAAMRLRDRYGIPLYASEYDVPFLQNPEWNLSEKETGTAMTPVPDIVITDGEVIRTAGFDITYIHTPGHTYGSGCYYIPDEGILFSGDTIFYNRHGKTIFATSDAAEMRKSLTEKLMVLPRDTDVFCGHEKNTTIGRVKPYFEEEYGVKL